ncbi:MAG: septum formation protein Maf [Oscillospiraceae bacterium]|nr:septum formation protein Maf [Oscillospiraceae bacterium]
MAIVLASASPRRKELMEQFCGKDLVIFPAEGEEVVSDNVGPGETVEALARGKAREVAARLCAKGAGNQEDIVIGADTIVWHEGRIFGKPHSREEAAAMLRSLSGCTHEVYTGVSLIYGDRELTEHEKTAVTFRVMTEKEILDYIATGEPMDKAGAYGAQGLGALFVSSIEGDFFNVMGLPLCRLGLMLKKTGVELL